MAEDNSWVFDSLVCFLHGPIWNAPLQTFVEEKSLIFDPNDKLDENNEEYVKIHNEYKNLVDYMLGSFMDELKITPEQFEVACLESRQNGPNNTLTFHQGLFQQIWAANDIRIFIRMMIQRNVELQLQALDLIERRQNSSQSEDDQNGATIVDDEATGLSDVTQEEIQEIACDSKSPTLSTIEAEFKAIPQTNPITELVSIDESTDKFQRLNLFFKEEKISSADVRSRQEYLRAQRDKLLEIKKKARAHQLTETVKKTDRPSSALAAQNFLENGNGDSALINQGNNEASLQLRKTLAKRLRTEVVGDGE